MDFNKLTIKSGEAVAGAQELARRVGNPEVTPDHLTIALLDQELPRTLVERAGASAGDASRRGRGAPRAAARGLRRGAQPQASAAFRRALDKAFEEAQALGDEFVSVEHLLLALDVVPRDALLAALQEVRGGQRVTSQDPEGSYQALEKYGRDLTALAEQGKLDPVIGRDEEIRRTIQVLSRRTKNNPVLIGEPGVGKTAIAEGLAQRIVAGDVPVRARGQARLGARRRRARRRREVPRRVRGAAQGRAPGDHRERGRDHPLHRRAPHDRRRGRGRGRRLRGQPAQADARARRAARGRRDDARRVPHAHREGPGARAPLPAGLRRRAVRRRHDRDPARPEGALRGAPRRPDPRRGARRRRGALRPLHLRPLPARQGDRPRRRERLAAADGDRLLARRARRGRAARDAARDRARRDGEGGARDARAAREGARRGQGAPRRARRPLGEREGRARPRQGDHAADRRPPDGGRARRARTATSRASPRSATGSLPELERELSERAEPRGSRRW